MQRFILALGLAGLLFLSACTEKDGGKDETTTEVQTTLTTIVTESTTEAATEAAESTSTLPETRSTKETTLSTKSTATIATQTDGLMVPGDNELPIVSVPADTPENAETQPAVKQTITPAETAADPETQSETAIELPFIPVG